MDLVRDLARALRDLDRAAQRYGDEELSEAVARLMKELGAVVEVLGKLADVHEELDMLVRGVLRLDSPAIAEVELKDGEDISSFMERCREAGADTPSGRSPISWPRRGPSSSRTGGGSS
jgi:hypothetical protein